MSLLIKGMEMPKKCIECKLIRRCGKNDMDYVCMPASVYVEDLANAYKPRPDYCPLVPVPPHGRLGDMDAIARKIRRFGDYVDFTKDEIAGWFENGDFETIIPAEEGEA